MAKKFAEHSGLNLTQVNNDILEMWREKNVFWRSVEEREGCPQFVFFEGPPSANGHPGIHHVLARTIKDTFNRYKTMKGFQVKRKAGWDTHGLPVELGVEKELGITKADIDNKASDKYISTEDYNKKCRENVMMFTQEWRDLTEKMGYFVDLDNPYITYDNKYIETLWWLLQQFYKKGLLYKGYTIQPYSPAAQPSSRPSIRRKSGRSGVHLTLWLGRRPLGLCLQTPHSVSVRRSTMWLWRPITVIMVRRSPSSWLRVV